MTAGSISDATKEGIVLIRAFVRERGERDAVLAQLIEDRMSKKS